jgi:hypothetical protein
MLKFAQITNRFYWVTPAILCVWSVSLMLSVCILPFSGGNDIPTGSGTDSHGMTEAVMETGHKLHDAQSASICMKLDCDKNSDCRLLQNSMNCEQDDSFTITPEFPQVSPVAAFTTWIWSFPEVVQLSVSAIADKLLKIPLPDLRLLTCVFLK